MARELVPDELWKRIEPLLPAHPPRPKGGRRRLEDRLVLTGIVFVLKTEFREEDLPREMGCGSGMTCWRRMHEVDRARGVAVYPAALAPVARRGRAGLIGSGPRKWIRRWCLRKGGQDTGPNPCDRGRAGSKHHRIIVLATDSHWQWN